jgi:hypothetical protein
MHDAKTDGALEPIFVSPNEAMRILDCGHSFLYGLINSGELEAVKDGKRTKIVMKSIRRRAASLPRMKAGKRVGA